MIQARRTYCWLLVAVYCRSVKYFFYQTFTFTYENACEFPRPCFAVLAKWNSRNLERTVHDRQRSSWCQFAPSCRESCLRSTFNSSNTTDQIPAQAPGEWWVGTAANDSPWKFFSRLATEFYQSVRNGPTNNWTRRCSIVWFRCFFLICINFHWMKLVSRPIGCGVRHKSWKSFNREPFTATNCVFYLVGVLDRWFLTGREMERLLQIIMAYRLWRPFCSGPANQGKPGGLYREIRYKHPDPALYNLLVGDSCIQCHRRLYSFSHYLERLAKI